MWSTVLKFYLHPKKIMLLFFVLVDEENINHPSGQKKNFFVLSVCIFIIVFIIRPYSPPVVLFDGVP